jgi:hypothetical protein
MINAQLSLRLHCIPHNAQLEYNFLITSVSLSLPLISTTVTSGASLKSNIALVLNNCRVGSEMAVHYAKLARRSGGDVVVGGGSGGLTTNATSSTSLSSSSSSSSSSPRRPVVVGAVNLDLLGRPRGGEQLLLHTSNQASLQ